MIIKCAAADVYFNLLDIDHKIKRMVLYHNQRISVRKFGPYTFLKYKATSVLYNGYHIECLFTNKRELCIIK